jgi:phosphoribosylformylglycinamidine (FGAM) synthase-like enzyme
MAEACAALDFPVVSGNVSLYNETKNDDGTGSAIFPRRRSAAWGCSGLAEVGDNGLQGRG